MIERLRKPGGTLGNLSLSSAAVLAIFGAAGVLAMLVSLIAGSDFWSDKDSDKVIALVLFALSFAGAVGFLIMDRLPWVGAALAVIGGLALGMVLVWTLVAIVVGLGAAVVGVIRARELHHGSTTAARPA